MKKLLNNPWFVGALSLVAVITVYLRLFDSKSRPSPPPPVNQPVAVASAPPASQPSEERAVAAPVESPRSGEPITGTWIDTITRDPFQRLQEKRPASPGARRDFRSTPDGAPDDGEDSPDDPEPLLLQAILMKGSNRIAVINNTFLKVGDKVDGFRVSQIKSDGVWLQGATDRQWLKFDQPSTQDRVS